MADPDTLKKKFEAWESRIKFHLEKAESLSVSNQEHRCTTNELKERLNKLTEQQADLSKVRSEEQKAVSDVEEKLRQANDRCAALRKYVVELMDIQQRYEQLNESELAEIEKTFSERKLKLEAQREAVSWYEDRLGFRVEPSTNALKIVFTKLDPNDMDRKFSFSIRHDKHTNLYTILECEPHLESNKELVDELNRTNKLYDFIRSMCSQFEAILLK
eukprot:c35315_g1_i1 orf=153-803(+)